MTSLARLICWLIAVGLGLGLAGAASALERPYEFGGAWTGSIIVDDRTGAFMSCGARLAYPKSRELVVFVETTGDWSVAFQLYAENLPQGDQPIRYRYDNGPWVDATARITQESVFVLMPRSLTAQETFRRANLMNVVIAGRPYAFPLTGTARLIGELFACLDANRPAGSTSTVAAATDVPPRTDVPPGTAYLEYALADGWLGFVTIDPRTAAFQSCNGGSPFKNDAFLIITLFDEDFYVLSIGGQFGSTRPGDVAVSYRFDNGGWNSVTGILDDEAERLSFGVPNRLLRSFSQGDTLDVDSAAGDFTFDLAGTASLVAQLQRCVATRGAGATVPSGTQVAEASPGPADATAVHPPEGGTGTGIVVSTAGHVLTNYHVIEQCDELAVLSSGDTGRAASFLRADPQNDLALIKLDDGGFEDSQVATFRVGPTVRAGEVVAVYGFPLVGLLSVAGNIVSGNVTALSGIGEDARHLQISAPIQPGNSGGPLIDASGLVMGVIRSKLDEAFTLENAGALPQNVGFAIKANVATNFLEAHSIPFQTGTTGDPLSLADIADKARGFGVLIACTVNPPTAATAN